MIDYAKAFRLLRKRWGNRCVWSDGDHRGRLEFAHLPGKPTDLNGRGRGRSNRYHDIRKHPGHYVLLCRGHHLQLDTGWGF